ncbi:hypothetical protein CEXT_625521 [Caerostris extrusa]|uniref:Uncharacterized protein n=1 Tax=Caerostris extrusa TaxID=172846 RepID=A0AAV4USL1_CAEEX|nr:hypothetical protein CEXT_625521 [Caerostris extrusa]
MGRKRCTSITNSKKRNLKTFTSKKDFKYKCEDMVSVTCHEIFFFLGIFPVSNSETSLQNIFVLFVMEISVSRHFLGCGNLKIRNNVRIIFPLGTFPLALLPTPSKFKELEMD